MSDWRAGRTAPRDGRTNIRLWNSLLQVQQGPARWSDSERGGVWVLFERGDIVPHEYVEFWKPWTSQAGPDPTG